MVMKIELLERVHTYSFTSNEKDYTIYINESNSYCNYEATDENGNQVSGDLLDDLMDDFWDSYSEAQPF